MLRKFALAGVLALSVHLAQPVARLGSEAAAQFGTPTEYYVAQRVLIIGRYEGAAFVAARQGNIFNQARAYQVMAIELWSLPTWGVDPHEVRVTHKIARLAFCYGDALLELNNPWVPDQLKLRRLIELEILKIDLQNELR
jgi:hypothetical protein